MSSNRNLVVDDRSASLTSERSFEFQDTDAAVTPGRWDNLPDHLRIKESSHNPHHHDAATVPFSAKFSLLFCKDLKLATRRKRIIGIEVLLPIICVGILSIFVSVSNSGTFAENYSPFNPRDFPTEFKNCHRFILAPQIHFVYSVRERLDAIMNRGDKKIYSFDVGNISDVNQTRSSVCAALVFRTKYNGPIGVKEFPRSMTYEIRMRSLQRTLLTNKNKDRPYTLVSQWATGDIFPRELSTGPRDKDANTGGRPGYYTEGFLFLQQSVDQSITQLMYINQDLQDNGTETNRSSINHKPFPTEFFPEFVRFPYPPFHNADIVHMVDRNLPIILIIGVSGVILCNTWLLVEEKIQTQWFLKTFGLSPGIRWGSWILREMTIHSLVCLLITGVLCTDWHYNGVTRIGFIDQADPSVFFFFLIAFYFNTICTSVLISVFFSDATNAISAAAFVNVFYFLPFVYVEPNYELLPNPIRYLLSTLAPSGVAFGCQQLALAEVHSGGTKWGSLFDVDFGLGHIILMLMVGGFVQLIIAIYIRNIYPTTTNEVGLPFLYPIKSWWWKGHLPPDERDAPIDNLNVENLDFFEADPPSRRRELQIHRLSKCFPRDVGIFNISMNFYEGETMVILGGHSSGKSTLMSIVTGNLSATRGTVMINKHNVQRESAYARSNLGMCPQDDLLFGYLTVEEIISFFVQLKGIGAISEAFEEVGRLVRDLEISDLRKVKANKLSATEKRLVHIAIAFSGGSKVVILDEPTQNMDHASQRIAWRFIEKEKERRCIIVLTKSAEESYFLSDRLAILVGGEILCRGSLGFINAKYGGGYHLYVTRAAHFKKFKLKNFIHRHIPEAEFKADETELQIYLPRECTPLFPAFFRELESEKGELCIESYRIAHMTTEEVFRQAEKQNESTSKQEFKRRHTVYKTNSEQLFADTKETTYNTCYMYLNQFIQLFMKNVRFTLRRWTWFLIPFVLPIIILTIVAYVITTDPFDRDLPPLNFNKQLLKKLGTEKLFLKCDFNVLRLKPICEQIEHVAIQMGLKVEPIRTDDLREKIIDSYDMTTITVETNYLLALEVILVTPGQVKLRVFFNNQPLHVPPVAVNFASNIILQRLFEKVYFGKVPSTDFLISVVNFPLEYTSLHKLGLSEYVWSSGFFFGLALSWGMTFLVPIFIVFPIRERFFKHLQMMSGASVSIFWFAKLLWDLLCFGVVCAILCLITFYFKTNGFNTRESIYALAIFIMIFGGCAIGIVNCLVPFFQSSGVAGYFHTWFIFFVMGPVPMSIVLNQEGHSTLHSLFLCLPNYAFGMGVFQMYSFSRYRSECPFVDKEDMKGLCQNEPSHGCCSVSDVYHSFGPKGVGQNDVALLVIGFFAHSLSYFLDTEAYVGFKLALIRLRLHNKRSNKVGDISDYETDYNFVTFDETKKEDDIEESTDLTIKNLKNLRGKGNLQSLDLSISKSECFCVIGAEGSGCETLLPLIAGLKVPATGDVYLDGENLTLTKNYRLFLNRFGYCQQFPSLMPELTGKEMLMLFGTLRRIPPSLLHAAITTLCLKLLIIHELENSVMDYNTSSLKKLATAIAFIGTPDFLLFEEPLTEIDQPARAQVISTLKSSKETSCIIISAESIDGYEGLCDRLAIFVNGTIRCTGSPKYLHEAFCTGYTITAKLIPEDPYLYANTFKMFDRDSPIEVIAPSVDEIAETGSGNVNSAVTTEPAVPVPASTEPQPLAASSSRAALPTIRGSTTSIAPWLRVPGGNELERKESPFAIGQGRKRSNTPVVVLTPDSVLLTQRQVVRNTEAVINDGDDALDESGARRFSQAPRASTVFQDPRLQYWERELVPLMDFIELVFPGAELVNIYPCFVHYHIPADSDLCHVFTEMEKARIAMDLESYTVGQASLEQVCINFTGGQKVQK